MFLPPDLDFYPQLITEGPLRQTVTRLIKALEGYNPRDQRKMRGLLTRYELDRRSLMERILRSHKVAWCDLCKRLIVGDTVRVIYQDGYYTVMATDGSYGPAFPKAASFSRVVAACSLHGEDHGQDVDIRFAEVQRRPGALIARVDGEPIDVTHDDRRTDPSDDELDRLGLSEAIAGAVPPPIELTPAGTLRMAGNPYVVLGGTS